LTTASTKLIFFVQAEDDEIIPIEVKSNEKTAEKSIPAAFEHMKLLMQK